MQHVSALELLILFVFLCYSIDADCGCNKIKRDGEADIASKYERYADAAQESCPIRSRLVGGVCEPDADTTFKKILRDHQHTDADNIDDMSLIPGGLISIGTENAVFPDDKESPPRQFNVPNFYLDKFETSNALFQEFVETTGYKTDAESYGDSFIFKGLISDEVQKKYEDFRVMNAVWWYKIEGVDWRHPEGVNSTIDGGFGRRKVLYGITLFCSQTDGIILWCMCLGMMPWRSVIGLENVYPPSPNGKLHAVEEKKTNCFHGATNLCHMTNTGELLKFEFYYKNQVRVFYKSESWPKHLAGLAFVCGGSRPLLRF